MRYWEGGGGFSNVCEIPLYPGDIFDPKKFLDRSEGPTVGRMGLQSHIAHKKQPPSFLGPPWVPRHSPSVGS